MSSKLTIDEHESGKVTILKLTGQILLDDGDLLLRSHVHDLVARNRVDIVLDLGEVTYIDSAGVGMVAAKLKTLRERGGDLKLLHLSSRGQRLFGLAKLLLIFETFESEESAVKSFAFKAR